MPTCAALAPGDVPGKRNTEPVALSSAVSTDRPSSGLAAFRVRSLGAASTYSRSVLGAIRKLREPWRAGKRVFEGKGRKEREDREGSARHGPSL